MEIVEYILNPAVLPGSIYTWYNILRFIFILASVGLLTMIVFLLCQSNWIKIHYLEDYQEIINMKTYDLSQLSKKWRSIKKKMHQATESQRKLAIIEADKLLDEILDRLGHHGETTGEKIKDCADVADDKEVWEAHGLRNDIIHDPSLSVSEDQAERVMRIYQQTLEKLKAI